MTADLAAFLRARLDEDEQTAKGVVGAARLIDLEPDFAGAGGPAAWDHWIRHDPARVLAEVDAKRRIIERHEPGKIEYIDDGDVCMVCDYRDSPRYPCQTLRLLVLPFADHPDYRPEWAPEA